MSVDPNVRDYGGGETLLHYAAYGGHLNVVEFLLERGVDPDVQGVEGNAPSASGTVALPCVAKRLVIAKMTQLAPIVPMRLGFFLTMGLTPP